MIPDDVNEIGRPYWQQTLQKISKDMLLQCRNNFIYRYFTYIDLHILYALKNTSNTTSVSNYMYSSLKMLYNSHSKIFTQKPVYSFLKPTATNNKAKTKF